MPVVTPTEPWTLGPLPWEMKQIHPLAAIFPPLDDAALKALAADIRDNGLLQPILVDAQDRILDGRARLAACQAVGRDPRFAVCHEDALEAILARNAKRRQLSPGQRALAAARALPHLQAEGRKIRRTLKRRGYPLKVSEMKPAAGQALYRQAARSFGISVGSLSAAQRVLKRGIPALVKAVEENRIKVTRAAWLARQSAEVVAQALWTRNKGTLPKVQPMPQFPPRIPGVIQVPRLAWGEPRQRLVDAIKTLAALSRMHDAYELIPHFPPAHLWDAEIGGKRALAFLDCFMRHWHHKVARQGGIGTPDLPEPG